MEARRATDRRRAGPDRRRARRARSSRLGCGRASPFGSGNRGARLVDAAHSDRRATEPACRNAGSNDRRVSSAPVAANPPAADLAPRERRSARRCHRRCGSETSDDARRVDAPPAPRTGKIRFSIKPWGEIIVDGKTRGVSPPIKELSIPEGRHRIEVRNGAFPGYESELDIKAGSTGSISYSFKAP